MTDAVDAIARILIEHGPLSTEDVIARLRDVEVTDPEAEAFEALDQMGCPAAQLVDGRWVWLPTLLAGRVFAHRVGAVEIEHDLLIEKPDLGPIVELCEFEPYHRLADGTPVHVALADYDDELLRERGIPLDLVTMDGAVLLAPGTLSELGVVAGDLVGLRLSEDGLVAEKVTAVPTATDIGDRVVAALPPDEPAFPNAAVWTVCVDDPDAFTEPVAPVGELLDGRGLVPVRDMVARPGFDAEAWRFQRDCEMLEVVHQLDAHDAVALRTLIGVYETMAESLSAHDGQVDSWHLSDEIGSHAAAAGAVLADPYPAELLRYETLGKGGSAAALGWFAETLESTVPRSAKVACRWLRASALEHLGSVEQAEREFLVAESMDTEWTPVLLDLARFASDRGDAERGMALLRRADADPDHPLMTVLEQHRATPRSGIGRNETCWCGSGRKYKKCHLAREQLPLEDRATWLYFKACQHVLGNSWVEVLEEVADIRAADASTEDEADALARDPLVMDAVLFEGGAFEEFVARRGVLLPEDERALAEAWLSVDRSVFEVEQVSPGRSLGVRDVRTGDVFEVRERTASRTLKAGYLFCARVVPVGEAFEIWGGIEPVALHARTATIELLDSEPDAEDLVHFLSARLAPPTLVNTEGDPLMMCSATVRVASDIDLDRAYDREDGQWLEHVVTDGMTRIRAVLTLDGDTLKVQAKQRKADGPGARDAGRTRPVDEGAGRRPRVAARCAGSCHTGAV